MRFPSLTLVENERNASNQVISAFFFRLFVSVRRVRLDWLGITGWHLNLEGSMRIVLVGSEFYHARKNSAVNGGD